MNSFNHAIPCFSFILPTISIYCSFASSQLTPFLPFQASHFAQPLKIHMLRKVLQCKEAYDVTFLCLLDVQYSWLLNVDVSCGGLFVQSIDLLQFVVRQGLVNLGLQSLGGRLEVLIECHGPDGHKRHNECDGLMRNAEPGMRYYYP